MVLLVLTLALLAMTVATRIIKEKPLDMALDSFDDRYQGCGPAMKAELPALNHSEFQNNSRFAELWNQARETWWREGSRVSPLSSSDEAIAITAGTMLFWDGKFNAEVRAAGRSPQAYWDNFHFKSLHFLLTDALATLRDAQGQKCHLVFWGTDYTRYKAKPGDIVRFGQFVVLSLRKSVAELFGNTTVFQVQTCHGADIKAFAEFPNVDDVLIPPFEKFKVTKVIEKGKKVEIHLDSIGTYSTYNCEWLRVLQVRASPGPLATSEDSSWPPQPWHPPLESSDLQGHQDHRDLCGHCGHHDHQDHQDPQRNKATKATKAAMATMATLATMASMWSLRPVLAL